MEQIKLLFLDIDGTIAPDSNQVTSAVKQAVKKLQNRGIKIGLATGRMYCSAVRFHHDIGADLPIIAYNGAWIQHPEDGQIIAHHPLNNSIALELFNYLKNRSTDSPLEIHVYFNDELYVDKVTTKTDSYIERSGITVNVVDDLAPLLSQSPTKLLALSPNATMIKEILEDLSALHREQDLYLTQSNPIYLEATAANVHKGNAIKFLTEEILGLSSAHVMAVGDNFNDTTMLQYAGLSVAMGNAPDDIKDLADYTTTSVDDDGVATIIETLLKGNISGR